MQLAGSLSPGLSPVSPFRVPKGCGLPALRRDRLPSASGPHHISPHPPVPAVEERLSLPPAARPPPLAFSLQYKVGPSRAGETQGLLLSEMWLVPLLWTQVTLSRRLPWRCRTSQAQTVGCCLGLNSYTPDGGWKHLTWRPCPHAAGPS